MFKMDEEVLKSYASYSSFEPRSSYVALGP
jgi:hypothetical protein